MNCPFLQNLKLWLSNKLNIILLLILIMSTISLGIYQYNQQYQILKKQDFEILDMRSNLMKSYIQLTSNNSLAMKRIFESAYVSSEKGQLSHPETNYLVFYPEYNVYGLSPVEHLGASKLHGNLTIDGSLNINDFELQNELNACFSIDPYIGLLNDEVDEIIWSYYTSKKGFIYIGPAHQISEFQFHRDLFQKEFWIEATPNYNPKLTQVITSLYDDAAGQGLMISISDPIVVHDEFIGVVSCDIGINLMNRILAAGPSIGETLLFDEHNLLVAKSELTSVGTTVELPDAYNYNVWNENNNAVTVISPIVDNELYMMHRIDRTAIRRAAMHSSVLFWSLEIIMATVVILLLNYHQLANERKELMLIDPLTKLYNRRGLNEIITKFYAQTHRHNLTCAVFLIDIDHFKKVNDNFGHHCGDLVIKSVADILLGCNRSYSTVARWGGEEFLIFIPDVDESNVLQIAERYRTLVSAQTHCGKNVSITISIGVHCNKTFASFENMVIKADRALYHAKQTGRNRSVIYTEIENKEE